MNDTLCGIHDDLAEKVGDKRQELSDLDDEIAERKVTYISLSEQVEARKRNLPIWIKKPRHSAKRFHRRSLALPSL